MIKNIKFLELIIFNLSLFFSIFLWLGNINLSPDSTNYIVSGQNFINNGTFFYWTNWPSLDPLSQREIFTDYPPGFSFLYSLFYLFLHSSFPAIILSQSVYILLFFLAFYYFLNKLEINFFFKICIYLLIPFFSFYIPILTTYLTEILFISLTLFIGGCAIEIIKSKSKFHWYLALFFISFSSTIKYIGFINIIWLLIPIIQIKKLSNRILAIIFFPILILIPTLLWFWRNWGYLNGITKSHGLGNIFIVENLFTPFNFLTASTFGVGVVYLLALNWLLITVLLIPNFLLAIYRAREQSLIAWALLIFLMGDFLGVYLLSLITQINPLEYRLLATPVTILIIALIFSLNSAFQYSKIKGLLYLVPIIILFTLSDTFKFQYKTIIHFLPHPQEELLWEHFSKHPYFINSKLFYTEQNFLHQIYSGRTHKVIWEPKYISSKSAINSLFNAGKNSFFIFDLHGDYLKIFKENYQDLSDLCIFNFNNFVIIYKSNNEMKCIIQDSNF